MSFVVVIPARYASTRLPGKPLADIHGKPMVQHVVEKALQSGADRVIVATDDDRVRQALQATGVSDPRRVLFVDDRPDNCQAAARLGLRRLHYTGSTDALRAALLPAD